MISEYQKELNTLVSFSDDMLYNYCREFDVATSCLVPYDKTFIAELGEQPVTLAFTQQQRETLVRIAIDIMEYYEVEWFKPIDYLQVKIDEELEYYEG